MLALHELLRTSARGRSFSPLFELKGTLTVADPLSAAVVTVHSSSSNAKSNFVMSAATDDAVAIREARTNPHRITRPSRCTEYGGRSVSGARRVRVIAPELQALVELLEAFGRTLAEASVEDKRVAVVDQRESTG